MADDEPKGTGTVPETPPTEPKPSLLSSMVKGAKKAVDLAKDTVKLPGQTAFVPGEDTSDPTRPTTTNNDTAKFVRESEQRKGVQSHLKTDSEQELKERNAAANQTAKKKKLDSAKAEELALRSNQERELELAALDLNEQQQEKAREERVSTAQTIVLQQQQATARLQAGIVSPSDKAKAQESKQSNNLDKEIESAENKIKSLELAADKYAQKEKEHESIIEVAKGKLSSVESSLVTVNKDIADATALKQNSEKKLIEIDNSLKAGSQALKEKETLVKDLKNKITTQEGDILSKEAKLEKDRQELQRLEGKLIDLNKEKSPSADTIKTKNKTSDKIKDLQAKIGKSEKEIELGKQDVAKNKALHSTESENVVKLKKEQSGLEGQKAIEKKNIDTQSENLKNLKKQEGNLRKEETALKAEILSNEIARAEAKAKKNELTEQKVKYENLKQTKLEEKALQQDIGGLKDNIASQQQVVDKNKGIQANESQNIRMLSAEIAQHEVDIKDLQNQNNLDKQKMGGDLSDDEKSKLTEKISERERDIATHQSQISSKNLSIKDSQKKIDDANVVLWLEKNKDKDPKEIEEHKAKLAGHKEELSEHRKNLKEANRKLKIHQEQKPGKQLRNLQKGREKAKEMVKDSFEQLGKIDDPYERLAAAIVALIAALLAGLGMAANKGLEKLAENRFKKAQPHLEKLAKKGKQIRQLETDIAKLKDRQTDGPPLTPREEKNLKDKEEKLERAQASFDARAALCEQIVKGKDEKFDNSKKGLESTLEQATSQAKDAAKTKDAMAKYEGKIQGALDANKQEQARVKGELKAAENEGVRNGKLAELEKLQSTEGKLENALAKTQEKRKEAEKDEKAQNAIAKDAQKQLDKVDAKIERSADQKAVLAAQTSTEPSAIGLSGQQPPPPAPQTTNPQTPQGTATPVVETESATAPKKAAHKPPEKGSTPAPVLSTTTTGSAKNVANTAQQQAPKQQGVTGGCVSGGSLGIPAHIYVNAASTTPLATGDWRGVAGAVKSKFGGDPALEADWKKHGQKVGVGQARLVGGDNPPQPLKMSGGGQGYLIHAGAPQGSDPTAKQDLKSAYKEVLEQAAKVQKGEPGKPGPNPVTVSCPPLGIGIYKNKPEDSAKAAYDAMKEFKSDPKNANVNIDMKFGIYNDPNDPDAAQKNKAFESALNSHLAADPSFNASSPGQSVPTQAPVQQSSPSNTESEPTTSEEKKPAALTQKKGKFGTEAELKADRTQWLEKNKDKDPKEIEEHKAKLAGHKEELSEHRKNLKEANRKLKIHQEQKPGKQLRNLKKGREKAKEMVKDSFEQLGDIKDPYERLAAAIVALIAALLAGLGMAANKGLEKLAENRFKKAQPHLEKLAKKGKQIRQLEKDIAKLKDRQTDGPPLTPREEKNLKDKEEKLERAQASFDARAALCEQIVKGKDEKFDNSKKGLESTLEQATSQAKDAAKTKDAMAKYEGKIQDALDANKQEQARVKGEIKAAEKDLKTAKDTAKNNPNDAKAKEAVGLAEKAHKDKLEELGKLSSNQGKLENALAKTQEKRKEAENDEKAQNAIAKDAQKQLDKVDAKIERSADQKAVLAAQTSTEPSAIGLSGQQPQATSKLSDTEASEIKAKLPTGYDQKKYEADREGMKKAELAGDTNSERYNQAKVNTQNWEKLSSSQPTSEQGMKASAKPETPQATSKLTEQEASELKKKLPTGYDQKKYEADREGMKKAELAGDTNSERYNQAKANTQNWEKLSSSQPTSEQGMKASAKPTTDDKKPVLEVKTPQQKKAAEFKEAYGKAKEGMAKAKDGIAEEKAWLEKNKDASAKDKKPHEEKLAGHKKDLGKHAKDSYALKQELSPRMRRAVAFNEAHQRTKEGMEKEKDWLEKNKGASAEDKATHQAKLDAHTKKFDAQKSVMDYRQARTEVFKARKEIGQEKAAFAKIKDATPEQKKQHEEKLAGLEQKLEGQKKNLNDKIQALPPHHKKNAELRQSMSDARVGMAKANKGIRDTNASLKTEKDPEKKAVLKTQLAGHKKDLADNTKKLDDSKAKLTTKARSKDKPGHHLRQLKKGREKAKGMVKDSFNQLGKIDDPYERLAAAIVAIIAALLAGIGMAANKGLEKLAEKKFKNIKPQLENLEKLVKKKDKLEEKIAGLKDKQDKGHLTPREEKSLKDSEKKLEQYKQGIDAYKSHIEKLAKFKAGRNDKEEKTQEQRLKDATEHRDAAQVTQMKAHKWEEALKEQLNTNKEKQEKANEDLKAAQDQQKKAEKDVKEAEKNQNDAQKQYDKNNNDPAAKQNLDNANAKLEDAQAQKKIADDELKEKQKDMDKLKDQEGKLNKAMEANNELKADAEKDIKEQNKIINDSEKKLEKAEDKSAKVKDQQATLDATLAGKEKGIGLDGPDSADKKDLNDPDPAKKMEGPKPPTDQPDPTEDTGKKAAAAAKKKDEDEDQAQLQQQQTQRAQQQAQLTAAQQQDQLDAQQQAQLLQQQQAQQAAQQAAQQQALDDANRDRSDDNADQAKKLETDKAKDEKDQDEDNKDKQALRQGNDDQDTNNDNQPVTADQTQPTTTDETQTDDTPLNQSTVGTDPNQSTPSPSVNMDTTDVGSQLNQSTPSPSMNMDTTDVGSQLSQSSPGPSMNMSGPSMGNDDTQSSPAPSTNMSNMDQDDELGDDIGGTIGSTIGNQGGPVGGMIGQKVGEVVGEAVEDTVKSTMDSGGPPDEGGEQPDDEQDDKMGIGAAMDAIGKGIGQVMDAVPSMGTNGPDMGEGMPDMDMGGGGGGSSPSPSPDEGGTTDPMDEVEGIANDPIGGTMDMGQDVMGGLCDKLSAVTSKLGQMIPANKAAESSSPPNQDNQSIDKALTTLFNGMKEGMGTLKDAANPQAALDTVSQTVEDPSSSMTSSMKMK
ncbi:MAG: hypothetical protein HYX61_02530 [Gammaproteobacteria bacterium]|nr:hypothetical protein [Gammaproteobacteria bacterium]